METDRLEVRTADNVGIGYETAGLGSRILAFLVDDLVLSVLGLVVLAVAAAAYPNDAGAAAIVAGFSFFFVFILYFAVCEGTSAGRTPGKRALQIRVVRLDGGAPGFTEALLRALARVVDINIGVFWMFFHPQSRRLGDLLAGTVVVRELRATALPPPPPPVLLRTPDAGPAIDNTTTLGGAELAALRTFLSRYGLTPEQRHALATQMAMRLLDRMQMPPSAPERLWPPELFLERLYLQLTAAHLRP